MARTSELTKQQPLRSLVAASQEMPSAPLWHLPTEAAAGTRRFRVVSPFRFARDKTDASAACRPEAHQTAGRPTSAPFELPSLRVPGPARLRSQGPARALASRRMEFPTESTRRRGGIQCV